MTIKRYKNLKGDEMKPIKALISDITGIIVTSSGEDKLYHFTVKVKDERNAIRNRSRPAEIPTYYTNYDRGSEQAASIIYSLFSIKLWKTDK
jgi:hypothetical protein